MGLLDRNKRKPASPSPEQSAAAPSSSPAAPSTVAGPDSDSLRDMLIAAVSAKDNRLVESLISANRATIAASFSQWQRVPEAIRENGGAMQRYANTLIMLAETFRDRFGDSSLARQLGGPAPDDMVGQWEQGLAQADALAKEAKFDEARDLLGQIITALQAVPLDTQVPVHAVTHGRLGHVLFAKGEVDAAAAQMRRALELSEQRNEAQGITAGLRGLYEIERYRGKWDEAAGLAGRISEQFAKGGNVGESGWWLQQSRRIREGGEPLCRVVFFVDDIQYEVDDVPKLTEARLRYAFVRNRPPVALAEALVHQAMQLGSQKKFHEAMSLFTQAAKLDPHDPSPHFQMAATLMHLQQFADAVAEYDICERLAPGWFSARSDRWLAGEIAAGRMQAPIFFILRTEEVPEQHLPWQQKLNLVEEAMAHGGELPQLLLYRSRCLMRLGRVAECESILRAALEKSPEPDTRTRILVDLQMVTPDVEEKKRLLNEAISLNGNLAAGAVARVTLRQL